MRDVEAGWLTSERVYYCVYIKLITRVLRLYGYATDL